MRREAYKVTAEHEATHWWFRARRELFLRQVQQAVAEAVPDGKGARLLDYGCGTGFNLAFLAAFGEVTGADVSPDALGEFRGATGFSLLDLRADLGVHHERFDVVTALDVLEHCDDDVEGLRAMRRFLTPTGQIVITVPAYGWLWSGEDVLSQHRRRYTKSTLVAACRAADLEVLYASYFNLAILPGMAAIVWAQRLLAPRVERSNVWPTPRWLNTLLCAVASREARLVGGEHLALPAGASLVARLRRATEAAAT